jgi:hypothetical protein
MAMRLWFVGVTLVALGLAARVFGWDALLRVPAAVAGAIRSDSETYGVIAAGVLLMVAARLIRRGKG